MASCGKICPLWTDRRIRPTITLSFLFFLNVFLHSVRQGWGGNMLRWQRELSNNEHRRFNSNNPWETLCDNWKAVYTEDEFNSFIFTDRLCFYFICIYSIVPANVHYPWFPLCMWFYGSMGQSNCWFCMVEKVVKITWRPKVSFDYSSHVGSLCLESKQPVFIGTVLSLGCF